ncbi:2-polyprenyl-6-methoxyphenol hydroxylase-like FAD-dependent oxidoreductase [Streptomyces umbrinus]|uniref:2-polyprenyl-6-methoxyphenol hydroxylase-like FAD-dependent oxidoreductase n=1 Tax=Streptomyces umbrinus TaxID=67370 RepID=A0ABU0SMG1_9ACTN|nr:FAD-dependent oxidoreductase [Streptomyces umbrinus]MDQ1024713.1 2-polyprenyl-6-methoxyphenol hydroxylase-like FAD-dependent oxidoreductase [Streptomyces umbrinus]
MTEPAEGFTGMRRAVVIGGGLAGMLAAAAVVPFADEVTIVERDVLPQGPEPRRGLPQAKHAHVLWSGGAKAIERLVPGVTDRWIEAGAQKIPLMSGMVAHTPHGWYRRWKKPTPHYLIACSRDLLDWHVRDLVLQEPRIRLLDGAEAVALVGDARRVTGASVLAQGVLERELAADLVIDASGCGSRSLRWLSSLGISGIHERTVDSGLAYASRIYQAPTRSDNFPVVNVQAAPRDSQPEQAAVLIPIENGRWLVSLSGTRGGEPTADDKDFVPFALQLSHPLVGMLIARATPLTDVSTSRSTANGRRYFEQAQSWPEGLVILGDAVATYNPAYGQGMSVAAFGAHLLSSELKQVGLREPGLARRVQHAVARPTEEGVGGRRRPRRLLPGHSRAGAFRRQPAHQSFPRPSDQDRRRLRPRRNGADPGDDHGGQCHAAVVARRAPRRRMRAAEAAFAGPSAYTAGTGAAELCPR